MSDIVNWTCQLVKWPRELALSTFTGLSTYIYCLKKQLPDIEEVFIAPQSYKRYLYMGTIP